ncbi:MAG: siderophore-interacting protein [Gammaproteobacteria bacterium]|nr:siderophore-interacting protein [Gammaproteobacteria bacterium]
MNSQPTRIQRIRHDLHYRPVVVARVAPLSPSFVSITFTGDALADFRSDSFDDHVKFMFKDPGGESLMRDYTPRHVDLLRRELTIEFALHGDGMAANWARQAQVGDEAIIAGPRGSVIVPMDYDWHLLIGDSTALPAIHRRISELASGQRILVLAQVDHPEDRRQFDSDSALDIQWVTDHEALLEATAALPWPQGEGFVWAAGESSTMMKLRTLLTENKQHPPEAMRIAVYWRRGKANVHEQLA